MKYLSVVLATLLIASCSSPGMSSGSSMGTSYGESSQPYSTRTLNPSDLYFGD